MPRSAAVPAPSAPDPRFRAVPLVVAVVDLTGYMSLAQAHDDLAVARFLDDYYCACERAVQAGGGRVVKFIGDACLAVFPPERAAEAVQAIVELREEVARVGRAHGMQVGSGANLHLASVVEGEFGAEGARRPDVLGRGVNHAFLLGRGAGMRLSEPVYRKLPSARRSEWRRQKPPAVYSLRNR